MKELEESLNELLYYDHEKFERDAMYDEGKREGEHKKQVEIAKNLLKEGLKLDLVQRTIDLNLEELKKIQQELSPHNAEKE